MALRIPRWVGLFVWPVVLGAVHIILPVGLSRSGRRRGWRQHRRPRPGVSNLVGLVPLCAGSALVTCALARHYTNAPDKGWAVSRKHPRPRRMDSA